MSTGLATFLPFQWFALRRRPAAGLAHTPLGQRLTLQGQQPRMIDASSGWHLKVLEGRVWLTQPGAWQDLFLGPGDEVVLRQAQVLLQAEPLTPPALRQEARAVCELRRLSP
jgi:hypothetical protein